jgi:holo-[acyl-carrier protein] synthase
MILGIGIDHVGSRRIKNVVARWPGRFEKSVFDDEELEYARAKGEPHLHLAVRFAAKEAFFKAAGRGFGWGINWTDVVVRNTPGGKPALLVKGKAKELAEEMGVRSVHVSLSHTRELGLAVVVLEG